MKADIASINNPKFYYDLWALRTVDKNNNCWNKDGCNKYTLKDWLPAHDLNKTTIPVNYRENIPVLSAFGGFTIYKTFLLKNSWYTGVDNTNSEECEHCTFHAEILEKYPKARFVIVPSMTN